MLDWSFTAPTLRHKGGAGIRVTVETSVQEITDAIKRILRGTTHTPDEAAFETVAQAARNIDWKALLGPAPVLVAPLLNAAPAAGQAITAELIDELCEHLKAVYYPLQRLKK